MIEFEQLISPLSQTAFVSDFWNKSFLRLSGQAGRFESLLTWSELNSILEMDGLVPHSILEKDGLDPPALKLYLDGKLVDRNRYMKEKSSLHTGGLIACLSQGATLIVDHVCNLAPRVRELADACEDALNAATNVNLYAGFGSQKGFDLHWDDEDTMILQLSGRKRWKIYRPTRLHPLAGDIEVAPQPTEDPVWDGVIEDGDVIYFPRGWWHVAYPLDEPSLHLTFAFERLTGVDLLNWFVGKLRGHAEVRMQVPRLAEEATQQEYVAALRTLVTETWNDEVLASFLRDWDARRYTRPRISLPFAPEQQNLPLTMETRIRLAGAHCLSFERDVKSETARFTASGRQWSCSVELVPALEALTNRTSISVRELCARLPCKSATKNLEVLLTVLAMTGVVLKEASNPPPLAPLQQYENSSSNSRLLSSD